MTPAKPQGQPEKKQEKPGVSSTDKAAPKADTLAPVVDEKRIIRALIENEMKTSYMDYAMSVIIGRALPDARDGLKPVHRRILYAMNDIGMRHNTPFKKCARIVGEVLGKYHPHGDMAVYDALVRMAQDFSLRYPLILGQGNFGCFTKDTKVQLADGRKLSFKELIEDDKQGKKNYTYTVDDEKIEIAEIKKPRLTIRNARIMKVVLDNDEEIKCTLNHRFMLKSSEYKEAQELKPDDSLMPFYTKISTQCLVNEACANHKVKRTEILNYREDVFDLTIDRTHNFALGAGVFVHNSVDGDNAAAMRYTEAKLAKISDEMLSDIDKGTVGFTDNFDGSLQEPLVLPSKFPNLLVNGSSGIAVGMATNIPPHNISEVCKAVITLIENPDIDINLLMGIIQGPDFPTGGIIIGRQGIIQAYKNGRGAILVRGKIEEEEKKDRMSLIITQLPYQVNKSQLIEQIADAVNDKTIQGISDIRDESARQGMRIVLELKKGANPEVVKNQLYKHTRVQESFGAIMLALINGKPKVMELKELLAHFLLHRQDVVRKRTKFDLDKAEEKCHILKGLLIALDHLDAVIKLIKSSKDPAVAKKNLITVYKLSDKQSQAILDMKLQRLTGLEQKKIQEEHKELLEIIKKLKEILADEKKILTLIKDEMKEIIDKYGDERKTMIEESGEDDIEMDDLIKPEENVITISHAGYIKRQAIDVYKTQRRGGRGVIGATTKEEDFVEHIFVANTRSYLLVFSDKGKVYWVKVYTIPETERTSKGKPIVNIAGMEPGEKIETVIPVREFDDKHYLLFATKKGLVKKTNLNEYSRPRKGGIIAINLNQGDEVTDVVLTDGQQKIMLASQDGKAVKFNEKDVRPVGRGSFGVRGIRLEKGDAVIGMIIAQEHDAVLTLTENGYGKRTSADEYRFTSRGGKGVINIICSQRNGKVADVKPVTDYDEIMIISQKGILIRVPVKNISVISRNTQGVRIMKLEAGDKVMGFARLEANGDNGEEKGKESLAAASSPDEH